MQQRAGGATIRLILHIGTEKTGTTSIQQSLLGNRELLQEKGYALLDAFGMRDNRQLARYCMRLTREDRPYGSPERKSLLRKRFRNLRIAYRFKKEMRALPASVHTVIVSSEFLHSRLLYADEVATLEALLRPYFSSITILCYIRPQVNLAVSFYSTALKDGYLHDDLDPFIDTFCTPENPYCNYDAMLSRYEAAFGRENIELALYGRRHFHENSLILDFYHRIAPELCFLIKSEGRTFERSNESLSILGQELLRLLNQSRPHLKDRKYRRLRALIGAHLGGKGKRPTQEVVRRSIERFAEANRAVAGRYFPERETLFDTEPTAYAATPEGIPESEQHLFREMLRLIFSSGR